MAGEVTRADLVKALRAATDRHQRVEESHRQRLERLKGARLGLDAAEEMANQSATELEAATRALEQAAVALAGGVPTAVR